MIELISKHGIALVFLLVSIDAGQEFWNPDRLSVKMVFYILLAAAFAVLPIIIAHSISTKSKVPTEKFNVYWFMTFCLIFISVVAWTAGVIGEEARAEGASQMHIIFYPIIIGLLAVLMLICCMLFNHIYSYFKTKQDSKSGGQ